MTPFFNLLYIIFFTSSGYQVDNDKIQIKCDSMKDMFNMRNIFGSWFVVAVIPGRDFPMLDKIPCCKMDVTKIDEDERRWLEPRKFVYTKITPELLNSFKGTYIRQRFHDSLMPFDVWSKAAPTSRGCYKKLYSLGTSNTSIADLEELGITTQFHISEPFDGKGPYMIQILWGRLLYGIILRRTEDFSKDYLDRIRIYVTDFLGDLRPLIICDKPTKEIEAQQPFRRP